MNVALKEWASVVAALDSGRQICLLRKGGIVEHGFQLREREFLLFPTYEHEHAGSLKPQYANLVDEPPAGEVRISLVCEVTDVLEAQQSLPALKQADELFIWNDSYLGMRVNYKPDRALYWILLRARRLRVHSLIPDRPSYAGCKSWVHLTEEFNVDGAEPVHTDEEFFLKRQLFLDSLRRPTIG